jgi:Skp family chaperone for outer membrane proteins
MKMLLKSALLAGLVLSAAPQVAFAAAAAPAPAASANAPGVAIANIEAIVANSDAFRAAQVQRPVTYKAQIDAAEARRLQITAQLQPLAEKFNRDRAAPNANQAALQAQAQTLQQIQENANQELQGMLAPVALSEAYVEEQITDKLSAAIQAAMTKNKVTLLLSPQNVVAANNGYYLNQAILTELNTAIPTAQLVPPAGWEPRQMREQRAAAAAAQAPAAAGAAPAAPARPAGPQPDGR